MGNIGSHVDLTSDWLHASTEYLHSGTSQRTGWDHLRNTNRRLEVGTAFYACASAAPAIGHYPTFPNQFLDSLD